VALDVDVGGRSGYELAGYAEGFIFAILAHDIVEYVVMKAHLYPTKRTNRADYSSAAHLDTYTAESACRLRL